MSRVRSSSRCSTRVASSPWSRRRGSNRRSIGEAPSGRFPARSASGSLRRVGLGGSGRELGGASAARRAVVVTGSSSPATESLNSRIPLPSERPISGSRFAPNTRSSTTAESEAPRCRCRRACAHDTTGAGGRTSRESRLRGYHAVEAGGSAPPRLASERGLFSAWHCSRSRTCTSRSKTAPRSSRVSTSPST